MVNLQGAAPYALALMVGVAGCAAPISTPVAGSGCLHGCGSGASGGHPGGGTGSGPGGSTGRSSTGGQGSSGANSSGGSSGSGAGSSSSGGSSSGGTTGSTCAYPLTNIAYDYGLSTPIVGAQVGIVNASGVPLAGQQTTTTFGGSFTLCPPQGVPITYTATDTSYLPTFTSEVDLAGADAFIEVYGGLPMISTTDYAAFQGLVGLQPGHALVVASVSLSGGHCSLVTGWTFKADFPDGGTLVDGGDLPFSIAYINGSFADTTLTSTTDAGAALLFNIDATLTSVIVVTASNPDAPADCFAVPQSQYLTGRIFIQADATSLAAWPLN